MGAGQCETGRRVIERTAAPIRGRVALIARLGESCLHVIRIRRPLEILQVAVDAGRIRIRQVVVVIHVARRTGNRCVRASQRETRGRVVEARTVP